MQDLVTVIVLACPSGMQTNATDLESLPASLSNWFITDSGNISVETFVVVPEPV